jgi:hypothetical protein
MRKVLVNKFIEYSKNHGKDGAFVVISTETVFSVYGGSVLTSLELYYLIPPLAILPVSLVSTLPLYMAIKKFVS